MQENKIKEIDIIALAKKVLAKKKSLGVFVSLFVSIGVIVALNKPKEYTSTVVLAPEMSSQGFNLPSSLSEMTASLGIDLNSKEGVDAIYPDIYPEIFASNDFIKKLFDIQIRTIDNSNVRSLKTHLTKEVQTPFWNIPTAWLTNVLSKKSVTTTKNNDPFILSKNDELLINSIQNKITCLIDNKTSVITISASDQDPLAAAILADTLQRRLQSYITSYRTKKAKNDYEYYKKMCIQSKIEYLKSQGKYASFADANEDVVFRSVSAKQDQYENEMQLRYNAYVQWASQMQIAKAKIQEKTPAFTIIQKPTTTNKASSTPKSFIVIIFFVLGIIADTIWVLLKDTNNK
jgi:uncharacterized protein involved in exopolysaccharide biosynthesis